MHVHFPCLARIVNFRGPGTPLPSLLQSPESATSLVVQTTLLSTEKKSPENGLLAGEEGTPVTQLAACLGPPGHWEEPRDGSMEGGASAGAGVLLPLLPALSPEHGDRSPGWHFLPSKRAVVGVRSYLREELGTASWGLCSLAISWSLAPHLDSGHCAHHCLHRGAPYPHPDSW